MPLRARAVLSVAAVCGLAVGGVLTLGVPAAQAAPVVVTTPDALAGAFENGGPVVQLGTDISLASLEVPDGASVTLDLGGHALSVDNSGGSGAAIGVPADAALTIEDTSDGGTGKLAASAALGAGIGGGNGGGGTAGTIAITGGTISATSAQGAGIGGGNSWGEANGGTVTVSGGTVTATGGAGAGIGGGNAGGSGHADGGTVTISGGMVTATGNSGGAGIGGGSSPTSSNGATVSISGGTVTATGSEGAGIGGGASGGTAAGGTVTITGGAVTARGSGGAGIGGGTCPGAGPAAGATLTVDTGGTLTVSGNTAIGPGDGVDSPYGTFDNLGHVTVASGTALLSKAQNFGVIRNDGAISVVDTFRNGGTITGAAPTPIAAVTGNNYTLKTADGSTLQVLAARARDADVSLPQPTEPPPTGSVFAGWHATGPAGKKSVVSATSSLPDAFGPGPATVTLTGPDWKTKPAPPQQAARALSPALIWAGGIAAVVVALGVVALVLGGRSRRKTSKRH